MRRSKISRKLLSPMSLRSYFHLILFLILGVTIFESFIFYAQNDTSTPIHRKKTSPLNLSELNRLNLQKMLVTEATDSFLEHCRQAKIDPFVVEPFLLFLHLTKEDQNYFVAKNLNPSVFRFQHDLITFGFKVKEHAVEAICDKLKPDDKQEDDDELKDDKLEANDLQCVTLYGANHTTEWHLNDPMDPKLKAIPVAYLFTHKVSNRQIQLVPFYRRTGSLWTGEIQGTKQLNFKFGQYEELFDDFQLIRPFELVQIPEDPLAYLMQKNSSRLIECDRITATGYYERYSYNDPPDSRFARRVMANIQNFKQLMADYRMSIWLSSGSLLGWYRQCNVLSFTSDIDFEADARFASEEITESLMANEHGFRFLFIWGFPSKGLEYTFARKGIKTDLFFVYPEENDRVAIFVHTKTTYIRNFYPKFDLCSGQLRGVRLNVPCKVRDVLEANFGKNWTSPVTEWDFLTSPSNLGPVESWPEGLTTYRMFLINGLLYWLGA